jgi:hypothetical protein
MEWAEGVSDTDRKLQVGEKAVRETARVPSKTMGQYIRALIGAGLLTQACCQGARGADRTSQIRMSRTCSRKSLPKIACSWRIDTVGRFRWYSRCESEVSLWRIDRYGCRETIGSGG